MNNNKQRMLELRKALEYFVLTLEDEEKILEVASIYPKYQVGKNYKARDIFSHGENAVGDPQLYQVLQDHFSQSDWTPENTPSLYKAIGISEDGIPYFVQPLGQSDSYMKGQKCIFDGKVCTSKIDYNVWSPADYPDAWDIEA